MPLSHYSISFLSDDIIRLRYVEIDGQLRKILMVVKIRAGNHSKDIREFEITDAGLAVGKRLTGFHGLLTGVPRPLIESIGRVNPSHQSAD
jgi:circadian clock protein KaiC